MITDACRLNQLGSEILQAQAVREKNAHFKFINFRNYFLYSYQTCLSHYFTKMKYALKTHQYVHCHRRASISFVLLNLTRGYFNQ